MIKVIGKGNISATIIAHSKSAVDGKEIITYELEYHRFVHSELMTHRCLDGNTKLVFDLPSGGKKGGFKKYEMTIKDFYNKWAFGSAPRKSSRFIAYDTSKISPSNTYSARAAAKLLNMGGVSNLRKMCREGKIAVLNPTKQRSEDFIINGQTLIDFYSAPSVNRFSLRNRLGKMNIRMLNEDSNEIESTCVTDVWEVGEKQTMTLFAGKLNITATLDHLILTKDGWKEMQNISVNDSIISCGFGVEDKKNPLDLKKIDGKWVSRWNKDVLKDVAEKQQGVCANCEERRDLEIHHILPVHTHKNLAFDVSNVVAVCSDCHHNVYHKTQGWQATNKLIGKPVKVDKIVDNGVRMVYDLSVASDYHNFVANDIVVHNCFSRNAASSRAIPVSKMIDLVRTSPATPIHWGRNQAGMQASEECNNKVFTPLWRDVFGRMEDGKIKSDWEEAIGKTREQSWQEAATASTYHAQNMTEAGYHKQITNRLLEPFQMIKVVVTATEFDNFFWLRFHKAAQPEIQELARCMLVAKKHSVAEVLQVGEWHTPYVDHWRDEDGLKYVLEDENGQGFFCNVQDALKVSSSCSAQVSYRKTDDSLEKADKVWQMLTTDERIHSSPTEHQATPIDYCYFYDTTEMESFDGITHIDKNGKGWSNNFCGWIQHRALIANNNCTSFDYDQEIDETGLVITDNKGT